MARWRAGVLVLLIAGLIPLPAPVAQAHDAGFSLRCFYNHRLKDDPIVYPGVRGASHMHEFMGNKTTNAYSTNASLRSGATNCSITGNRSGYWIPTLYNNEAPVTPLYVNIYYRPGSKDRTTVKPFPQGLKVIAGNGSATSPQGTGRVTWGCGANGWVYFYGNLPNCASGYDLVLYIWFPDCWNGTSLDSSTHKAHMAYASNGRCPSTHPKPMPQLVFSVHYPVRGGSTLYLSSGGKYSGHADFMEAWDRTLFQSLVTRCINQGQHCHY